MDLLSKTCGYTSRVSLRRIAHDFQCTYFRRMDRWGKDQHEQNEAYTLRNHIAMATDQARVDAFRAALHGSSYGRHVLDVGCGPFCLLSRLALLAGASTVDCVEENRRAVQHAIDLIKDEADGQMNINLSRIGASFMGYELSGRERTDSEWKGTPSLDLDVQVIRNGIHRKLQLFQGFSSDAPLPGGYNLVVHEILGHVASSEGVVNAIRDLHDRCLLTQDCEFIPRRAATLFVPTMQIQLSCVERILCLQATSQGYGLQSLVKYHADRFPEHAFLAKPAFFEDLDFSRTLQMKQHEIVEFVTDRSGVFDGVHLHKLVDLAGRRMINTLRDETSWNTTYVRLLDPGIFLPVGSRITCETWIEFDRPAPYYWIAVFVESKPVAKFSWSGCTG
eukprot:TRINITY_DN81837_c0_g1_i1.p1 TRINITY_DN81837_c0_g1~~TRINITY_DN81837_c0_g1_i1.p1  ORF type:complete len:452 (+),score=45.76 TRINITY_DN81837_c0_g1_i1:184-1356(+)